MNKVILIGRLTAEPETRYTESSQPMAISKFRLAVDRPIKKEGEPQADFIKCIAFGKTAEFVEKYLRKGTKIALEGSWRTGSYTKDGATHYTNDCVIDRMEFVESKKDSAPQAQPSDAGDGFMNIPDGIDEELPFN